MLAQPAAVTGSSTAGAPAAPNSPTAPIPAAGRAAPPASPGPGAAGVAPSLPAGWSPPPGWMPPPGWAPPAGWVPPPGWAPPSYGPEGWAPPAGPPLSPGRGPAPGAWRPATGGAIRPSGSQAVPNYLWWAVASSLLFWPTGLAAIAVSVVANRRAKNGDLDGARRASRTSKTLCWITLIVGLVDLLLLVLHVIPPVRL